MAKKFRGVEIVKQIKKANDLGLARFLLKTQSKLSENAPVDSGRFASSWFIGQGSPNRSKAKKRKGSGKNEAWRSGVDTPVISVTEPTGKITADKDHWISNNLPYAERVCIDPKWAKNGANGEAWFTTIVNNLGRDAKKDFEFFLRKVK